MGTEPGIAIASDGAGLLCPGCGYDLRATAGGRCSECGLAIDREALKVSGFAWAHRRKIGRVRAYLKTLWQVAAESAGLAHEAGKMQEAGDARSFRYVTAGIVACVLLGGFAAAAAAGGGLTWAAAQPSNPYVSVSPRAEGAAQDLIVPWCAGATLWPVLPACLALLAVYVTGVQRAVFHVASMAAERRERVAAVALYAAAPLAMLLPAVVCAAAAAALTFAGKGSVQWTPIFVLIGILWSAAVLLWLIAIVGTVVRVGQWVMRVRHCGFAGAALAASELVGLWVAGVVVLFGFVPWCAGFLWVVIDSMR